MKKDLSLTKFLGRWLTSRMIDDRVSKTVLALHGSLNNLKQGDLLLDFPELLVERINHLKMLLEAVESHPLDQQSHARPMPLARWLVDARQLVDRWNESATDWFEPAIELSAEKNPLMIAAISQSLAESVNQSLTRTPIQYLGETMTHLPKLKSLDERDALSPLVPPAAGASWDPSNYVLPELGRMISDVSERVVVGRLDSKSTEASLQIDLVALLDLFAQIKQGWPIARSRFVTPISAITKVVPPDDPLGKALLEASRLIDPVNEVINKSEHVATKLYISQGQSTTDDLIRQNVVQQLNDLLGQFQPSNSAEVQEYLHRIEKTTTNLETSSPNEIHQELVGHLAFVDQLAQSNRNLSTRPLCLLLAGLAEIAQGIGGGRILDRDLLGHPLSEQAEFVRVLGTDHRATPGESRRITRVEQVGYVLFLSNGERRVLVKAQVWISP